jgi:chromosomal replication initiator protein
MYAPDSPDGRSAREIWEVARSQLRLQLPQSTYDTWVRDTACLAHEDGAFVIGVNNAYAREWLQLRLRRLIKQTLVSIVGHAVDVTFIVQPTPLPDAPDPTPAPLLETTAPAPAASAAAPKMPAAASSEWAAGAEGTRGLNGQRGTEIDRAVDGAGLNPRYNFGSFIVGPANRMAHASAMAVAERPGTAYNPLFIYGGSGLGKTHLLQAIGHSVLTEGLRVLYVTSEIFTNELITAIRTGSTDDFRTKYRNIDVLLLDDVHFIAGKEQTQEEFFHTFNALHSSNRQIVLTSDRAPQAIPTLEDRLRSRFAWGMIADIQPPNLETRVAILQSKAASMGRRVPDDVLLAIAQRAHRNIRDLEGALTKVVAHAETFSRPVSVTLVEEALAYLAPAQGKLTPETILNSAAEFFGIPIVELTGRNRSAKIALPRQIVMYVMREELGASLPQIGQVLSRDHTTVMHGIDRVVTEMERDASLAQAVNTFRNRLYEPVRVR